RNDLHRDGLGSDHPRPRAARDVLPRDGGDRTGALPADRHAPRRGGAAGGGVAAQRVPLSWPGRGKAPYSPRHGSAPWKLAALGAAKLQLFAARLCAVEVCRAGPGELPGATPHGPRSWKFAGPGRAKPAAERWTAGESACWSGAPPANTAPVRARPAPCLQARRARALEWARGRAPDARLRSIWRRARVER